MFALRCVDNKETFRFQVWHLKQMSRSRHQILVVWHISPICFNVGDLQFGIARLRCVDVNNGFVLLRSRSKILNLSIWLVTLTVLDKHVSYLGH